MKRELSFEDRIGRKWGKGKRPKREAWAKAQMGGAVFSLLWLLWRLEGEWGEGDRGVSGYFQKGSEGCLGSLNSHTVP